MIIKWNYKKYYINYFKDLFKYKKAFNVNNNEIKIDKKIYVSGNIITKKNKRVLISNEVYILNS